MITYFPKLITHKAIMYYFFTLTLVSVIFFNRILPLIWILFGAVEVCSFFYFSNLLTKRWRIINSTLFVRKIFWTALGIRVLYMVFAYFFYDVMTGQPFMFHSADEQFYYNASGLWLKYGIGEFSYRMQSVNLDDSGEIYWTAFLCLLFGHFILTARIAHCLLSALTCVLIYRITKRHFEDSTARMAAVLCVLMPNLIYYCGVHLKEADMVCVTVLLVDGVDALLNERKFNWVSFMAAVFSTFALFTFRSALGIVGLLSVLIALALNRGKLNALWKKVGLTVLIVVAISMTTIGNRLLMEVNELWREGETNQDVGMEYRAQRTGGNSYARYASGVVFAPAIFTLPFASMVNTEGQENQQMLHGGNFTKNIISGFTIFAIVLLFVSGDWRKHTLLLALMIGYLILIAFSNFAHSERFHQPVLPFELMFAAYGISQLQRKHVKWIDYWMVFVMLANVGWAYIKLAGRGAL